jgi:hypothetical protein
MLATIFLPRRFDEPIFVIYGLEKKGQSRVRPSGDEFTSCRCRDLAPLGDHPMALLSSLIGAAAVGAIYVIFEGYRDYLRSQIRRESRLHERVAHLLWKAAQLRA